MMDLHEIVPLNVIYDDQFTYIQACNLFEVIISAIVVAIDGREQGIRDSFQL